MEYLPGGVHGETSQKPEVFRCRPLPAEGGIWYFVDINKKV